MIFVTVGTQLPFDRLVRAVDGWARAAGRDDVFAQVGSSSYRPVRIQAVARLSPGEFARRFDEAELVVSHAGMGTVISAMERGKRLVVMPRRADRGEHRTDHQVATARRLVQRMEIAVADNEAELVGMLERLDGVPVPRPRDAAGAGGLIRAIRAFVDQTDQDPRE